MPPIEAAIGHEEQLVGAIMAGDVGAFPDLLVEHFAGGTTRAIWSAMLAIRERGAAPRTAFVIDELSVQGRLQQISWGDHHEAMAVHQMAIDVSSRAAAPYVPGIARAIVAGYEARRLHDARTVAKSRIDAGEPALEAVADLAKMESQVETGSSWAWLDAPAIFAAQGPVPWLVEGLGLAPGAPTLVAGYGYSRKTMALMSMALSVAAGRSVWGVHSTKGGLVRHIDHEQGGYLTRERYARLARGMGLEVDGLPLQLTVHPKTYLDSPGAESEYMRAGERCALVILDSLRAAIPSSDENSSEVRRYLDILGRVSDRTGCVFAVVHHATKPSETRKGRYTIRGSGALFDACGSVFCFSAEKGEPTTVAHEKDRIRGNDLPSFGLDVDDIERDGDPRWGLRVRHLEPEQLVEKNDQQETAKKASAVERARRRVTAHFDANPSWSGTTTALRELVDGRKADVCAAVADLIREGALTQDGDRGPVHRYGINGKITVQAVS